MLIYHIVSADAWDRFTGALYEADSLSTEGFIHCSFREQLGDVIERYYKETKNLVILEIDSMKLSSKLVVEPSTGGEKYPHIYGPINVDAIVAVTKRNE